MNKNLVTNDAVLVYSIPNYVKTKDIIPLKKYLLNNKLSKSDIDALYFFIIENKKQYLINFFNKSLKISDLDLTNITLSFSNNKNPKYKNLIRNIYYKDILLYTNTEIPNIRPFLEVLFDLFNNNLIDYKLVTPSSISMLSNGHFSNILSGFYFRSSILNSCVLYSLSFHLKGTNIFTPTLGWSSYMYGFLNNPNIIDVKYIQSENKNVPFSEIRWYIKCQLCQKKCFYNWYYDPYIKDISIINHNHIMKLNGYDTLSDFYKKKFYKYCNNCSYV